MNSLLLAKKFHNRVNTFTAAEFINRISSTERKAAFSALNALANCSPQEEMSILGKSYPCNQYDVRALNNYTDYEKRITRVYDRKLSPDGYAMVKDMLIRRQRFFTGRDGSRQELDSPWYISITSYEAIPVQDGVGYKKGTERNQKSAFINITDEEMLEICYNVNNFVKVWMNAICIPAVMQGCQRKEAARMERLQGNPNGMEVQGSGWNGTEQYAQPSNWNAPAQYQQPSYGYPN